MDEIASFPAFGCLYDSTPAADFEHGLANMLLFSISILAGGPVTVKQYLLGSLLPSTIGNSIGAALCFSALLTLVGRRRLPPL